MTLTGSRWGIVRIEMTSPIRRALGFAAGGAIFAGGLIVACASLPAVSYVGDVLEAGSDASLTKIVDSSAGEAAADAGPNDDGASTGDDAEADADATGAAITCGDASVSGCDQCTGAPLACKKGAATLCVADCTECATGLLPCWRCPGGKPPRGNCLAVNAKGVLACPAGGECACDAAADCPQSAGSAEVCTVIDASANASKCLTCGEGLTNGEACVASGGATGTCSAGTSTPTCQ